MRTMLASVALAIVSSLAIADEPFKPVPIHNGFLTGNEYRARPESRRRAYVMGVVDGLMLSPVVANNESRGSQRLSSCLDTMRPSDEQLTVIVDRWVDAHPASWGGSVHTLVYGGIAQACNAVGAPLF
jgi:hypothetical protein